MCFVLWAHTGHEVNSAAVKLYDAFDLKGNSWMFAGDKLFTVSIYQSNNNLSLAENYFFYIYKTDIFIKIRILMKSLLIVLDW